MSRNRFTFAALLIAALCGLAMVRAEETAEERTARLEQMSAAEKEELARKKARYEKLSPEEKARIRKLCEDIEKRPDARELKDVMSRYHEWLKTLSSTQLAELRALPEEKRLDYVKKVKKEQQQREFLQFARDASPEDLETVFEWLKEFVYGHREDLLKSLPGDFRRRVEMIDDEDRQTLILIHTVVHQPPHSPLRPGRHDVERLIPQLSPPAQTVFRDAEDVFTRIQLLSIWSWGALWSNAFPNVTSQQLASYFSELSDRDRERLERLPASDRENELKRLYYRDNFFRRGELPDRSWERGDRERDRGSRRGRDR